MSELGRFLAISAYLIAASLTSGGASADVTISSAMSQNMSCAGGVCVPTAANAVLNAGDLRTMLQAGDVSVLT
jgi:hypothetical protein